MSSKGKAKSPILEAVHETAADLHRLGFIDKRGLGDVHKKVRNSRAETRRRKEKNRMVCFARDDAVIQTTQRASPRGQA
jgi:hypothetical protein